MDRHYLAQTIGTGSVFSFFLLFALWVLYPDKARDFVLWVTASGKDKSSGNLILAFGAVQPVIGIIIDTLWLPFANRFQYDRGSPSISGGMPIQDRLLHRNA